MSGGGIKGLDSIRLSDPGIKGLNFILVLLISAGWIKWLDVIVGAERLSGDIL